MYAKYQEAVDALRHEQLGRKESEAILQRVWSIWSIIWWCLFLYAYFFLCFKRLFCTFWMELLVSCVDLLETLDRRMPAILFFCEAEVLGFSLILQVLYEIEEKAEVIMDERGIFLQI